MNKWEKNLQKVQRAQARGLKLVEELERQGFKVSQYTKELLNRPLRSRYTEKQMKTYLGLASAQSIKSSAKSASGFKASQRVGTIKNVTQSAYVKHQAIKKPRFQEKIAVRLGHETEDLARAFYKQAKYAINKHPSRELDTTLWRMFKILKTEGLVSKSARLRRGELQKYFNSISEKDFVNAYVSSKQSQNLEALRNIFYMQGRSSKEAYDASRDIAFEEAKRTFASNYNLSKDKVDAIYEFFKYSKSWNDFMKMYLDSNQENFSDYVEEIAEASEKKGVTEIDTILSSGKTLDEILSEIRM